MAVIKCKHCDETFGRRSRYNTHLKVLHNQNPYIELPKCPLCDRFFFYKSNATVHLKRVHKKAVKHIPSDDVKEFIVFEETINPSRFLFHIICTILFIVIFDLYSQHFFFNSFHKLQSQTGSFETRNYSNVAVKISKCACTISFG